MNGYSAGSGPLGSGPTGPGSGFSVMPHENGGKQRLAKRRHVQGMLDETDPLKSSKESAVDHKADNQACDDNHYKLHFY